DGYGELPQTRRRGAGRTGLGHVPATELVRRAAEDRHPGWNVLGDAGFDTGPVTYLSSDGARWPVAAVVRPRTSKIQHTHRGDRHYRRRCGDRGWPVSNTPVGRGRVDRNPHGVRFGLSWSSGPA